MREYSFISGEDADKLRYKKKVFIRIELPKAFFLYEGKILWILRKLKFKESQVFVPLIQYI